VSKKKLVIIEGAGHGLAFPCDPEKYYAALKEFFDPLLED
jgi:alpha-beta hydrolase superfamily lysophospholipase